MNVMTSLASRPHVDPCLNWQQRVQATAVNSTPDKKNIKLKKIKNQRIKHSDVNNIIERLLFLYYLRELKFWAGMIYFMLFMKKRIILPKIIKYLRLPQTLYI